MEPNPGPWASSGESSGDVCDDLPSLGSYRSGTLPATSGVFSSNTGRSASTWDTFQDADAQSFDVILLQEHGMKGSELHALIRFASFSGSCSFAAEPQERRNEAQTSPGRAFLFTKRFSEPGSWPVLEPQILARFWNMGAEPRTP